MPDLATDGLLVAGDAAGLCLAAGIWLEGVNFAIGSGAAAAETAIDALHAGDASVAALGGYRRKLEANFVLRDHKKLRLAPQLVLSDRVQHAYPNIVCDMVESLFTVENPRPKIGGMRATWTAAARVERPPPRRGEGRMGRPEDVRMTAAHDTHLPEMSFEDRMATVEFRVAPDAHIVVDGDACRGCTTRECVTACPAEPLRADGRRWHPLQLRRVLRMRHVLHDLQHRGSDHVAVSRRRPRCRVSEVVKMVAP